MPREKLGNKRYGLYISPELNIKLNEYIHITRHDDVVNHAGRLTINAQDVLRQALKEFLEKHLK